MQIAWLCKSVIWKKTNSQAGRVWNLSCLESVVFVVVEYESRDKMLTSPRWELCRSGDWAERAQSLPLESLCMAEGGM